MFFQKTYLRMENSEDFPSWVVFLTITRLPSERSNASWWQFGWKVTWLIEHSVFTLWADMGGGITTDDISVNNSRAKKEFKLLVLYILTRLKVLADMLQIFVWRDLVIKFHQACWLQNQVFAGLLVKLLFTICSRHYNHTAACYRLDNCKADLVDVVRLE